METTPREPFDCDVAVPGWRLHLAHLMVSEGRDLGNVMDMAIRGARNHLRRDFPGGKVRDGRTIRPVREAVARAGVDPDRTPPCSEALLQEFLEQPDRIRGSLAWEILALLTIKSQAPWSVLDRKDLAPPLVFRTGGHGETISTAAGILDCEGLPVLADTREVRATPWTHGSPHDLEGCQEPVFVCYLPDGMFRTVQPKSHMGRVMWLTWAYRFVFERTCAHESATHR